MAKENNRSLGRVWLAVLLLCLCITATTIAVATRLHGFLLDDSGAISLIYEGEEYSSTAGTDEGTQSQGSVTGTQGTTDSVSTDTGTKTDSVTTDKTTDTTTDTAEPEDPEEDPEPERPKPTRKPGFTVEDGKGIWSTETSVEIFRISYENGEHVITVNSGNGDKVIAPGTENSYVFKLKNTGNVPMDYTVEVEAFFSAADLSIPITGRLSRYDGQWIVGSKDAYAPAAQLNGAADNGSLSEGNYTYYTLDWCWPFEGNDALDTLLGDLATEQDLTFTIIIRTTATENTEGGGGILPPPTNDAAEGAFLVSVAGGSFLLMIFVLLLHRRSTREDREANH